ncbi:hypothetical protein D3C79_814000 [compost metagenome]
MGFYQFLRAGYQANGVGVLYAARQYKGIVEVELGIVEGCIHAKFVGRLVMIPAANGAWRVTQDIDHCAVIFQCITRTGQFHLFETIGD